MLIAFVLALTAGLFKALVGMQMWIWFVVETGLSDVRLNYWAVYGLFLLISLATVKTPKRAELEEKKDPEDHMIEAGAAILYYALAWGFAGVVHLFIV